MKLSIPYLFKLNIGRSKDCQELFYISFWTPLFDWAIIRYHFSGRDIGFYLDRYGITFYLYLKSMQLQMFTGFNTMTFTTWKIEKLERKLGIKR